MTNHITYASMIGIETLTVRIVVREINGNGTGQSNKIFSSRADFGYPDFWYSEKNNIENKVKSISGIDRDIVRSEQGDGFLMMSDWHLFHYEE